MEDNASELFYAKSEVNGDIIHQFLEIMLNDAYKVAWELASMPLESSSWLTCRQSSIQQPERALTFTGNWKHCNTETSHAKGMWMG